MGFLLKNSFRPQLWQAQKEGKECVEILRDLTECEKKETVRKNETYRINNEFLVIYIDKQAEDVQYWRVAVPNNE